MNRTPATLPELNHCSLPADLDLEAPGSGEDECAMQVECVYACGGV